MYKFYIFRMTEPVMKFKSGCFASSQDFQLRTDAVSSLHSSDNKDKRPGAVFQTKDITVYIADFHIQYIVAKIFKTTCYLKFMM